MCKYFLSKLGQSRFWPLAQLGLFVAALGLASLTLGATANIAVAEDLKIGYVDLNLALNQVEDGKAAKAKLKNDFDGKQKKLDKMQASLKSKKEGFDSRAAMMKPETRQSKQEELQREFMELQQTYMKLQQELIEQETRLTKEISEKLRKIIERIGDREGYTMILNIADNVLYYKRHREITDDVVREYNAAYNKK